MKRMFLGGNLVTWRNKKQNVVARLSVELFCENKFVSSIANNLVQRDGTKADRHMPTYAKKIVEMYNQNGQIEKMLSDNLVGF
ncbi:7-hydroxymethyl chlorophyll a reductase, chloroplastic, partial [Mucuna pruriens]